MNKKHKINNIVLIAVMSAISSVLMMIDFPLFFAPSFMKFDISELPALFNAFYIGPVAGGITIIIKVLLKLIFKPTTTGFIGEFVNIFAGIFFVVTAGIIYKINHTKKGAILSLCISVIFASIMITIVNAYITFPMYGLLYGLNTETIVSMANKVNKIVNSNLTLMLFSVLPFNIVKYTIISIITFLLYNKMNLFLKNKFN